MLFAIEHLSVSHTSCKQTQPH